MPPVYHGAPAPIRQRGNPQHRSSNTCQATIPAHHKTVTTAGLTQAPRCRLIERQSGFEDIRQKQLQNRVIRRAAPGNLPGHCTS